MIAELELGRYRRARFWDGECPGAGYGRVGVLTRDLTARGAAIDGREVAVELVVPRGPMVMYGLVGCRYEPARGGDGLTVRVEHSAGPFGVGDAFASTLAISPERPVRGLPLELAEAVVVGIDDALGQGSEPGPGVLTCACAAYGAFGSSPVMFRALSRVVSTLLSRGTVSEAELCQVISEQIRGL
jgi:hypothetical protein